MPEDELGNAYEYLIKKFADSKAMDLAEKILMAPDHIYAAAMMKENSVLFGAGDFQNIIDILKLKNSPQYKDIGNKLALVKTGRFYKKGILPDINDPEGEGIPAQVDHPNQADFFDVYKDKGRATHKHNINGKHVFKIWSTQVHGQEFASPEERSSLTQVQMENIFPDFRPKL